MKYLLMIIMAISCIGISMLINKSRKNRGYVLNEMKNSTKAFAISEYFENCETKNSKYLSKLRTYLADLSEDRATVAQTHEKILKAMPEIFNKSNDSAFLMKYLRAVNESANQKIREGISLRCEKLIKQNKDEIKSNMYIAAAIALTMVILAI